MEILILPEIKGSTEFEDDTPCNGHNECFEVSCMINRCIGRTDGSSEYPDPMSPCRKFCWSYLCLPIHNMPN